MTDRVQAPTPEDPPKFEELTTRQLDEVAGGETGAPLKTTRMNDFHFVILS